MTAPPRVPIHTALHGPQLAGWQPSPAPQARYKVLAEPDVEIPLPDGTVLRGDIYRPASDEPVPALLSWAAYNKDLLTTWVPAPFNETGVVGYQAACGYAVLIANPRGCGRSDGSFGGLFSEQEAADLEDTIEWLAGRPFCNGRVGMTGMSYFAVSQLRAAVRRPKHLGAVFPFLGLTDIYRHAAYHGGSLHAGFLSGYFSINGSAESLRIPAERRHIMGYVLDTPVARAVLPQVLPRVLPRVAPHLEPPDLCIDEFAHFAFDHPLDGDLYRLRSPEPALGDIDIPVLIGSEWGYVALHLFGAFSAWHHVQSPKKLFIGAPGDRWPWARYQDELLAFYDRHLNDVDNGWDALPAVRYWLMGADRWEEATDWPVPDAEPWMLQLGADTTLADEAADTRPPEGRISFYAVPAGLMCPDGFERTHATVLAFETAPLPEERHVVGPVRLRLRMASTALDANVVAKISDVSPDGSARPVTMGWLLASHRTIDEERSNPTELVHDHTSPLPLVPGEPTVLEFSLHPFANLFAAGHRVRLELSSDPVKMAPPPDSRFVYFPHLGPPYPARNDIICWRDGHDEGSVLELRVR